MKISKKEQKAVLHSLFFEEAGKTPEGLSVFKPKQFVIDKLFDAASAAKKLLKGAQEREQRTWFVDGEVEFTPAEVAVLKGLFDANKDKWDITQADVVGELQELFNK